MRVKFAILMVWMLGCVLMTNAATVRPLTVEERASTGADIVVEYGYADLTSADTNGATETHSDFTVLAKQGVALVAVVLDAAFDTANTNHTGSTTLTIGDDSDADLFLESMELASDGTEVWLKMGRANSGTITATPTLQTATINGTNVMTNVTISASFSVSELGSKVYTAADTIDFDFIQSVNEGLTDNTVGKVRAYFRLWDAR